MANDFWKALMSADPLQLIALITLVVYMADLIKKFKDTLRIKTKSELDEKETQELRKCYNEQFEEINASIKKMLEDLHNVTDSSVMVLGDQLSRRCKNYIKIGYIPLNESAYFDAMYDTYHEKLHGNHGIDSLYQYCKNNLKIVDEEQIEAIEDKEEDK